jgi:hypothetical protein
MRGGRLSLWYEAFQGGSNHVRVILGTLVWSGLAIPDSNHTAAWTFYGGRCLTGGR